MRIHNSCVA